MKIQFEKDLYGVSWNTEKLHKSHVTRSSDASSFDEICINCGERDISGGGWGNLRFPCKKIND